MASLSLGGSVALGPTLRIIRDVSVARTAPFVLLALLTACKPAAETKGPDSKRVPAAHARVDLIPSSATFLVSADVAAFSGQGYRELLPWLDDPDQPENVSAMRGCYTGDLQTAALGGIFEEPMESMRFAAVMTGPGLGAAPVVACFSKGEADSKVKLEVWSEDPNTLIVSSASWAAEVRSKSGPTSAAPLSAVFEHVDTDAHAWFAVRLPSSVDEQLRSSANWLSELAAKSTDQAIKFEATETPTRDGIGYVAGSLHLDDEGLDGRVLTTFETRESVDLAHAVLDIGFVLVKHLGTSPKTASDRLAHEFALHTTISRSGDRIEARTRMSAEVLADAADQAHDTLDIKKMLGMGDGSDDGESLRDEDFDTEQASDNARKPRSPLATMIAEAAREEPDDEPDDVDSDLVFDACEALESHLYPLEECVWALERLLEKDDGTATRMLRCVAGSSNQADVLECDADRLLNPQVARRFERKRRTAAEVPRTKRAQQALRKALSAAKTDAERDAIYAEICDRMTVATEAFGGAGASTETGDKECIESAKKQHQHDRARFEVMSTCALLHEDPAGFMACIGGMQGA